MHPVDKLFSQLKTVEPYPQGVCGTDERIAGTAFFPGGDGLWKEQKNIERPAMPIGKIMVLGHNFDSVAGFRKSVAHGSENMKSPTWRYLINFLHDTNINPNSCFYTNVYMGLISGGSNVGKFPGSKDKAFVSRCLSYLKEQLAVVQPLVVLVLGIHVPALLANISEELSVWRGIASFRMLDDSGIPKISKVTFSDVHGVSSTVVALTHPSRRDLNVGRRKYKDFVGSEAEIAMVNEALIETGLKVKV